MMRDGLFETANSRNCNVGRFSHLPLKSEKCNIAIPVSPTPHFWLFNFLTQLCCYITL